MPRTPSASGEQINMYLFRHVYKSKAMQEPRSRGQAVMSSRERGRMDRKSKRSWGRGAGGPYGKCSVNSFGFLIGPAHVLNWTHFDVSPSAPPPPSHLSLPNGPWRNAQIPASDGLKRGVTLYLLGHVEMETEECEVVHWW